MGEAAGQLFGSDGKVSPLKAPAGLFLVVSFLPSSWVVLRSLKRRSVFQLPSNCLPRSGEGNAVSRKREGSWLIAVGGGDGEKQL